MCTYKQYLVESDECVYIHVCVQAHIYAYIHMYMNVTIINMKLHC